MTFTKALKKVQAQEKANAKKTAYVQPLRPRSTVFSTKKDYKRADAKKAIRAYQY